jgi:hypothetical protein
MCKTVAAKEYGCFRPLDLRQMAQIRSLHATKCYGTGPSDQRSTVTI